MERWDNRAVRRLLWPLILEQLLAVTVGIVDTAMVARLGEEAVSGVSLVDQINQLLIILFTALSTGGAVVASHYIGRGDRDGARGAARQLIILSCALSFLLMALTLCFYRQMLSVIYGEPDALVMKNARDYLKITALSMPFLAFSTAVSSLFRASGNTAIPLASAVLTNIVNIGANVLLIFVLRLGVPGAALGTVLCRAAGCFFLAVMQSRRKNSPVYPERLPRPASCGGLIHSIKDALPMIIRILRVGVPAALENSAFQAGKIILARLVSGFGTAAIAANAITGAVASFVYMPGTGFGLAILTITGQCIGAGDYAAARRHTKNLIRTTYITIGLLNIMILVFMDLWLGLFDLSPQAGALTRRFLTLHCITSSLAWPLSFALPYALRAAGDARYVMTAAISTMWLVRIGSAYALAYLCGAGAFAVWIGMSLDFFFRAALFLHRWRGGLWQKKRVI